MKLVLTERVDDKTNAEIKTIIPAKLSKAGKVRLFLEACEKVGKLADRVRRHGRRRKSGREMVELTEPIGEARE